jgi:TatD DNase family protein
MGYFLGITGPVTFKKAEMLRNVVTSLPAEMLLTETDSPFLTPHPHRGERNEPAYVKYITEEISRLRQDQIGKISQITSRNAERLFNW